ncbi:MAG TPA: DNA-processing protein DprA [Anaerolineae bacterium]|nr:DNA-processing protein DprA [Anaerolineae bacterium]
MTASAEYLWYKLLRLEGFGPVSLGILYRTIREQALTVRDVFEMDEAAFSAAFPELGRGRLASARHAAFSALEEDVVLREYRELQINGVHVVHPDCGCYAARLVAHFAHGAPVALLCRGNLRLLTQPSVAIIGSRGASHGGLEIAGGLASDAALLGYNVVSGYAKGVDTRAHLGALEAGGTTSIVLSFGILRFSKKRAFDPFPLESAAVVVSQFLPYANWSAGNAMTRNKLVCALSQAVVVVESRPRRDGRGRASGTFDAGKVALQMGVPLFVVTPSALGTDGEGNGELLLIGGIEIPARHGMEAVLGHLQRVEGASGDPVSNAKQGSLFDDLGGSSR